jgi:hypothetical protein
MTVQSEIDSIGYDGPGSVFAIPFRFLADGDIRITKAPADGSAPVTLTLTTDYSLLGARQQSGGQATLVVALVAGDRIVIDRGNMQRTQLTDYRANDPFPEEAAEDIADRLTMLLQQAILDGSERSLRLPPTDIDGSGAYQGNGNRIVNIADAINPTDVPTYQQVIGAGSGNFIAAGAGAQVRTMQDKAREWRSVEDDGAVGDGLTLDDVAFAAAAALGAKIRLIPGKTYHLSQGVAFVNGTGFICPDGIATIKLKTGTGGFTNVAQGGTRTALDRCVFQMVGTNDNVIEGIEFVTDGVKECCLYPIRTSGGFSSPSQGLRIERVRFRGFSMGTLVGLNTVGTGSYTVKDVEARDCGTSQGIAYWGAGTGQFTVFEIDNDMVAATPSQPGYVENIRGTNILHTGTAVTDFGQQTDIVNVAGISGTDRKGPTIIGVYADGVGEAIDMFCTGAVVKGVRVRNVHNFVVKLVHGAQNNQIDVDVVESYGLACVTFSGSSSLAVHTQHNSVRVGSVKGCGDAGLGPVTANIPVVLMQENGGAIGTCLPRNNVCIIDEVVAGANLDYIVRDNCSVNNTNANFVKLSKLVGLPATSFATCVFPANTRARYMSANPCRLTIGTTQVVSTGVAATVQYNTAASDLDSIANTGTFTIAPRFPGWYRIRGQVRVSGNNATDNITMRVQKNASTVAQKAVGYATSAIEVCADVDMLVYIGEDEVGTVSANLTIQATHVGSATANLLNTATMSYLEVCPVAG